MAWLDILALPAGIALAWGYVVWVDDWVERYGFERLQLLGVGLVSAALIYLVAAIVKSSPSAIALELAGVLLFMVFARLGSRRAGGYLALGWALHVAWDLLAQLGTDPVLPRWYAIACLGFDLVVARAILRMGVEAGVGRRSTLGTDT